jgi:hypothetical protein
MRLSRHAIPRRAARLAFLALLVLPWLAAPKPALAYLDPGTGSILLQIIIGGVAGLGVVGKLYWHRLRGLLGLDKKEPQKEPPSAAK